LQVGLAVLLVVCFFPHKAFEVINFLIDFWQISLQYGKSFRGHSFRSTRRLYPAGV
jgi:hypothetical protein